MVIHVKQVEQSGFCCRPQTRGLELGGLGSEFSRIPHPKLLSLTGELKTVLDNAFRLHTVTGELRVHLISASCS